MTKTKHIVHASFTNCANLHNETGSKMDWSKHGATLFLSCLPVSLKIYVDSVIRRIWWLYFVTVYNWLKNNLIAMKGKLLFAVNILIMEVFIDCTKETFLTTECVYKGFGSGLTFWPDLGPTSQDRLDYSGSRPLYDDF